MLALIANSRSLDRSGIAQGAEANLAELLTLGGLRWIRSDRLHANNLPPQFPRYKPCNRPFIFGHFPAFRSLY
jgi:hypothetical protein